MSERRWMLALVIPVIAAGCAVSTQQEVALGTQYAAQVDSQLPILHDPALQRYIDILGDSIANVTSRADLQWHFAIVNTDVVNAFALPGGFVYVNRGIIEHADKMDELAGVMAHEIGHVVERHSVKQMQQVQGANVGVMLACILTRVCESQVGQEAINIGGTLVFAKFSREDEAQADEEGFKYLVKAGISPEGMVSFFQKLLEMEQQSGGSSVPAWFSDHPLTQDRIADIQNLINQLPPGTLGTLTEDTRAFHDFKARIMALPPAPPPAQQPSP
ncbi:MAG TPA: M48 family metallopeptidase [Gemmatimonadaceae bacterium]|nr:M48 family metallopeptidase [Gemmatimonadaceae bacterium]